MPRFRREEWRPWRWRIFGPILPYDLITSSRRVRWYVLRFLLASLMLFVLWKAAERFDDQVEWYGGSRENAKAAFASEFYVAFASIHLTAALLLATAFLGGSIADERRRRILEFMFATDLTNREIILGKFASRAYMIGVLLFGSLPILACTMMFGGVVVDWIVQLAVVTVSTLLCFGGLSVLVSTSIARPRDAVVRSMALSALILIGPYLFLLFGWGLAWIPSWVDRISVLNPYHLLSHQQSTSTEIAWERTYQTFLAQSVVGAVALTWAVLTVRRTVVKTQGGTGSKKPLPRLRRFFRPELGAWPPIFWREAFSEPAVKSRGPLGRVIAMFIFASMNLGIVGTWLYAVQPWSSHDPSMRAMGILACLVSFIAQLTIATRAASLVTSEREADTWTTLIAGPIAAGEIVTGKVLGAIVGFWHLLVPFALCWLLAAFTSPGEAMFRGVSMFAVCLLVAFVNANIGFLFSMRSKSTTAATVKTIIAVLFLAGGYLLPLSLFLMGGGQGVVAFSEVFLIGFPAFAEWKPHPWVEDLWAIFIVGMFLYLMLAVILHAHNRMFFDGAVGRLQATLQSQLPPSAVRFLQGSGDGKTEEK
jgi:ABC-type transport system involved in multi-copper enzyme maturation permease subunit